MKISTKGRYGIRLMLSLALHYDKGTLALKSIAREQDISEKYLEQIINPLTKSGLVKSYRGAQGGYILTREPKDITIGEVLRILEGSLSPVDCVDNPMCPNSDTCVSLSIWKKMKEALDDVVDNISLADMAEEYKEKNEKADASTKAHGVEGRAPLSEALRHKRIQTNFYATMLNIGVSLLAEVTETNRLLRIALMERHKEGKDGK